jgi:hypothetical protein
VSACRTVRTLQPDVRPETPNSLALLLNRLPAFEWAHSSELNAADVRVFDFDADRRSTVFRTAHRTNSIIPTPCLLAGFGRLDQRYANKTESILIRALCQQQV